MARVEHTGGNEGSCGSCGEAIIEEHHKHYAVVGEAEESWHIECADAVGIPLDGFNEEDDTCDECLDEFEDEEEDAA